MRKLNYPEQKTMHRLLDQTSSPAENSQRENEVYEED